MIPPDDHFRRLAALLEMEAEAEARQTLERVRRLSPAEAERGGDCLLDLVVRDEVAGLGGRVVVALGKRIGSVLPWTRLQVGSPVLLSLQGKARDAGRRGVVCERDESLLRVAVNDPLDADDDAVFRVDRADDQTARLRQRQALDRAAAAKGDRLAELRGVLLGGRRRRSRPYPTLSLSMRR